jgi:hypothetical protein
MEIVHKVAHVAGDGVMLLGLVFLVPVVLVLVGLPVVIVVRVVIEMARWL